MQPPSILDLPPPPPGQRIAYGADPNQFGHLRMPPGAGPHPVAIVLHGGFWRAAYDLLHIGHLCEAITRAGIATWSLEYRRIGQPGGAWPGTFEDVRAGAAHLLRIPGLDTRRVAAIGHSAGGHLALWLAAERPVPLRGAVSLAGVADLRRAFELGLSRGVVRELMGASPEEAPDRYRLASPIERLPVPVPLRLLHGIEDDIVPIEIARRFHDAALRKGVDVRLAALPGAGHFELIDPRSSAWPPVLGVLESLLGGNVTPANIPRR
jgi:dipeptidyl aminopeptidase/acylaminoacyl peptidase